MAKQTLEEEGAAAATESPRGLNTQTYPTEESRLGLHADVQHVHEQKHRRKWANHAE